MFSKSTLTMALLAATLPFAALPVSAQTTDDTSFAAPDQIKPYTERESVTVRGKRNQSRGDVMDKALYEAADETLDEGFDWFRILERDRDTVIQEGRNSRFKTRQERVPVRECGLLSCRTTYRTEPTTRFDATFEDRDETRHTVTLDIEMGHGTKPAGGNVYDAKVTKGRYK